MVKYQRARKVNNGIYNCTFLNSKKVLVLVPHPDDELITVGTILPIMNNNQCEINLVYATNGDYHGVDKAEIRLGEALRYGKSQGVHEQNIIFMGFGDQGEAEPHLYNCNEQTSAPSGRNMTYALENHDTYAKQRYGREITYTRDNYKKTLKDILKEKKADIIFCIDCDIHSDHIALSLLFEEVLTELIKEEEYQPIVFKMFAHDMLWMGLEDSYGLNLGACRPISENPRHTYALRFQETIYPWEERIRFPIDSEYVSHFAVGNQFLKTMLLYKSQHVSFHFPRLLNSDQIFWLRRTDNLILKSRVCSSSGDTTCFSTLKMFDCKNVCKKQQLLEESELIWKPDNNDTEKKIIFEFHKPVKVGQLVFYTGFQENYIKDAILKFDDEVCLHTGELKGNGKPNIIRLENEINCSKLEVQLIGTKVELIKIEAFSDKPKEDYFVKIMIDNNFVYRYILKKRKLSELKLQIYYFGNVGNVVLDSSNNDFRWYVVESNEKKYLEDVNTLKWERIKTKRIGVELVADPSIFDEVEIKQRSFYYCLFTLLYGKIEWAINKFAYKIVRIKR